MLKMTHTKTLSLSEISSHTSKDDCWLIIRGKVYDVTPFLEDHPGADDVLLQATGGFLPQSLSSNQKVFLSKRSRASSCFLKLQAAIEVGYTC